MSNDNERIINILELPSEVLHEILSYVPDQLTLGPVCKTFYNISCRLKTFRLNITAGTPSKLVVDIEEDEEAFESILNSGRKIDTLFTNSLDTHKSLNCVRLLKIIKHIGENVKELQIRNESFNIHGLNLLNLMPNLEILELGGISCKGLKLPQDFELRLNKLQQLRVEFSPEKFLEVFDHLPDDVLRKVKLFEIKKSGRNRTYFQSQQSIKHLDLDMQSLQFINAKRLKLNTFEACWNSDFLGNYLLQGKDELTSLTGAFVILTEEFLHFICNELAALEVLHLDFLIASSNIVDLSKLQKLANLKKLSLGTLDIESLKTLRSNSLQFLHYWCLTEEVIPSLSVNCPNLREIEISYKRNFAVDKLIDSLPKLEKLTCNTGKVKFALGWENQGLKHLHSMDGIVPGRSVAFIKCCKNLKTLSLGRLECDAHVDSSALARLLIEVPTITTLCLHKAFKMSGIIKQYATNLQCIHMQLSPSIDQHDHYNEMKNFFKDQLPVCKMMTQGDEMAFYLKKHGSIEKCCEKLEEIWEE